MTPNFLPTATVRLKSFSTCAGQGIGGDVIVLRFAAQQEIAHAAADPIGGEAGLLKAGDEDGGGIARGVSTMGK